MKYVVMWGDGTSYIATSKSDLDKYLADEYECGEFDDEYQPYVCQLGKRMEVSIEHKIVVKEKKQ